jgi:Protein of unknown function (DUF3617)
MRALSGWFASAAFALSLTAVAAAQAPALNVNMGLWEITSVSEVSGQMPGFDTSKMTPDEKAKMDEAMKAFMGKHTNTDTTCMTKEQFDKSNFMTGDEPGPNCKQTLTTNTRTTLEGAVACTGERPMTAQMHIDALSPTAFKASMKSATTDQGKTMTVAVEMTGKWVGASCGNKK